MVPRLLSGIAIAIVALLTTVASCYDAPRPSCGFWCGPGGECPSGYLCDPSEGRCFANGANPADFGRPCPDAGVRPNNDFDRPMVFGPSDTCSIGPALSCVDVVFSEPVVGVMTSSLYILDDTGIPLDAFINLMPEIAVDAATIELELRRLELNRTYRLVATSEIRDRDGNSLVPVDREFSRQLTETALIAGREPAPNIMGVSVATTVYVSFVTGLPRFDELTFELSGSMGKVSAEVGSDTPTTTYAELFPRRQLQPNTTHVVRLTSTAFASPVQWTFDTGPDTVAPNVTYRYPSQAAQAAPVDATIEAFLDEEVTITSFTLETGLGVPVAGDLTNFMSDARVTFDPHLQLAGNTFYSWELVVVDAYGNSRTVVSPFTTTVDSVAPKRVSTVPLDADVGVLPATTISITFDEQTLAPDAPDFLVTRGGTPVVGTVTTQDDGRTWVFTPSMPLMSGTMTHMVQIIEATDAAGNSASYNWSFVTAP